MPTPGRKPFRTTISTQNLTHFHVLEDSAEGNNSCAHLARVAECWMENALHCAKWSTKARQASLPEGRGSGVGCKLLRWLPLVINCKLSCRPSLSSARTQFKDATFNAELKATLKLVKVLPVTSKVKLAAALHLQAGKLICVFPLGRVFILFSSLFLRIYVGVSGL